jgi:hypothetical protein
MNIRHRVTGYPLPLFFLDIKPAANNNKIQHSEYLWRMGVQNEPPHQTQNNTSQCKRCKAYFHTKGHCAYRPRCVKCGKSHSTEQCTLSKTQLATCLHCGESHPASYRGCKVHQEIVLKIFFSTNNRKYSYYKYTGTRERKPCSTTENCRTTDNDIRPSNQKYYRNANNHSKQHTRTYTNQNNETVLHKVLNNIVQTSTLMNLLTTVLNKLVKCFTYTT